jgi:hypothetical protein
MFRRGSVVVPTAPYVVHHPWQVEWDKGVELKCYTGIIRDQKALVGGEWEPKRFPEKVGMSMAVTSQGMSQRSISQGRVKMQKKPYATGAKSGSAKIKFRESFGRATAANAVALDEQKGYAFWKEPDLIGSGKPDSIYLILHSQVEGAVTQWYISWVNETDLLITDYKIAVIKKNVGRGLRDWTLLQLWKTDINIVSDSVNHFYEMKVTETATAGTFRVKFQYDRVIEGNMTTGVSYRSWVPSTPWANQYNFHTPTLDSVALSEVESQTPHKDITQTTYFFLEFTHAPTIGMGDLNPSTNTGNLYEWIADSITDFKITYSTTQMSGFQNDSPNTTDTLYRYPLGYVEIINGIPKAVMQTYVKPSSQDILRIDFGGTWSPSHWEYQEGSQSYVMTSATAITGNWYSYLSLMIQPFPMLT